MTITVDWGVKLKQKLLIVLMTSLLAFGQNKKNICGSSYTLKKIRVGRKDTFFF